MNIILIAPPAAGKGTQAQILSSNYNLFHLSTGDLLREIASSNTELGIKVKNLIDNGNFIDDELMLKLLKEKISTLNNVDGIIFDGFPRTIKQAEMLDSLLLSMNQVVDNVIYLEIEKDIAMKRATGRFTCPKCGNIYNIYFDIFKDENKCNNCGEMLQHREDDTESKFEHRFNTYLEKTKPVIDYYNALGLLKVIDASRSKDEIYNQIKLLIEGDSYYKH